MPGRPPITGSSTRSTAPPTRSRPASCRSTWPNDSTWGSEGGWGQLLDSPRCQGRTGFPPCLPSSSSSRPCPAAARMRSAARSRRTNAAGAERLAGCRARRGRSSPDCATAESQADQFVDQVNVLPADAGAELKTELQDAGDNLRTLVDQQCASTGATAPSGTEPTSSSTTRPTTTTTSSTTDTTTHRPPTHDRGDAASGQRQRRRPSGSDGPPAATRTAGPVARAAAPATERRLGR